MEIGILICLEILVSFLLKDVLVNNLEVLSIILLAMSSVMMTIYILRKVKSKKLAYILIIGFIIRMILVFVDVYLFRIPPHSGADSEAFHSEALKIFENIGYLKSAIMGIYPKCIGLIYCIIGPQRIWVQHINVILNIILIIQLIDIFKKIGLDKKIIKILIIMATFFPHNIIFSSILLREMVVAFFFVISIKKSIYWIIDGKILYFIQSIIYLLIGSMFHSGIAPMLIVYLGIFSLYNKDSKNINISIKRIFIFFLLFLIAMFLVDKYSGIFLRKFERFESVESIFDFLNVERGGSAYLSNVKINNLYELIVFTPLKIMYFLFSPMPWDIRGIMDMITYVFDSIMYIYMTIYIIQKYKYIGKHKNKSTCIFLIIGLVLVVTIFSYGTGNVGTAIRHRNKLFYLLLIIFGITKDSYSKYLNDKKIKMKL